MCVVSGVRRIFTREVFYNYLDAGRDAAPALKKSLSETPVFFFKKEEEKERKKRLSQFPKHGVGVSYMTDLSDTQVKKGGEAQGGGGGVWTPCNTPCIRACVWFVVVSCECACVYLWSYAYIVGLMPEGP